jgi:hypothetical protein
MGHADAKTTMRYLHHKSHQNEAEWLADAFRPTVAPTTADLIKPLLWLTPPALREVGGGGSRPPRCVPRSAARASARAGPVAGDERDVEALAAESSRDAGPTARPAATTAMVSRARRDVVAREGRRQLPEGVDLLLKLGDLLRWPADRPPHPLHPSRCSRIGYGSGWRRRDRGAAVPTTSRSGHHRQPGARSRHHRSLPRPPRGSDRWPLRRCAGAVCAQRPLEPRGRGMSIKLA